jgi:hypothetical protein
LESASARQTGPVGLERGDRFSIRQIAERQPATFAALVLEIERLAAVLALK